MTGETNLKKLLQTMQPHLNEGDYVFCTIANIEGVPFEKVLFTFKEKEGMTIVVKKQLADDFKLPYTFTCSWITLKVFSALEAVGLTAAFSTALANAGISCNVVAGYYHDHIFVKKSDADNAMKVLNQLSK